MNVVGVEGPPPKKDRAERHSREKSPGVSFAEAEEVFDFEDRQYQTVHAGTGSIRQYMQVQAVPDSTCRYRQYQTVHAGLEQTVSSRLPCSSPVNSCVIISGINESCVIIPGINEL